jgi:protein O-mannosyl-transferase
MPPARKLKNPQTPALAREPAPDRPRASLLIGLLAAICLATVVVHWPALSANVISFDDDQYLTQNKLVQHPSWPNAGRFMTEVLRPSTVAGYYQPLSMISLMLDSAAGGQADYLRPYHRTSLALHVANTALVMLILLLLFSRPWEAAAVALLFGIHPLSVEPIPWIGERKTLLAAFFGLWSLVFYIRYARRGGQPAYLACILMYVLALLAKPTTTPLPVAMLLLDFWPLRRLSRKTIMEKIPLFAIAAVFAVITFISQKGTAGVDMPQADPLRGPLILAHNVVFYLYKMVLPLRLSSHYPFPKPLSLAHPMVLAGAIGTVLLLTGLALSLRRTRALATGWLIFFVIIFPAMGVIGFTNVIASDKYAYLPAIGMLLILTWAVIKLVDWARSRPSSTALVALLALAACVAGAEAFQTRQYYHQWRDTETFYRYMLTFAPDAPPLHNDLGLALVEKYQQERLPEAIEHYRRALALKPIYPDAENNLGVALARQNQLPEAVEHLRRATDLRPDVVSPRFNLAQALSLLGRMDEAVAQYQEVIKRAGDDMDAHRNLGDLLARLGRNQEAAEQFSIVLQLDPSDAQARARLSTLPPN